MNVLPRPPAVSLADAESRYKDAVEMILDAYDALQPPPVDQVTPRQLDAAIRRFLALSTRLEREKGERPRVEPEQISHEGEYGITLLMDLGSWARRLRLRDLESEFDAIALAFADWVVRHGGELRTIEPVVDALANLANDERDPRTLERLTHLTSRIIRSTATGAKTAVGQAYPNPPWRLLNLNHGIVATRTHNPALMEQVFDELVQNLPGEAPRFFAEGMQQMEKYDFPLSVRAVMARYFDRWTRPRMH